MTMLGEALQSARRYWEAKGPSSRMMATRAETCGRVLGGKQRVELIGPSEATRILTRLHETKGKGSVPVYYAAFKRAVELAGGDTRGWPKAGSAPRRCREALGEADLEAIASALDARGQALTRDLLELLRGTGLRVEREALNGGALEWNAQGKLLKVTGKGDHQRIIPVGRPETAGLLGDPQRLREMRRLGYSGHLRHWNRAVEEAGIVSLKPTPHAVRHYYATRAYERSGHNLRAVQELLGHADISTTSRYLGVNMEELRRAVA